MTEVFERSASSSSESDTYSSDESSSYTDTDTDEEDERSVEEGDERSEEEGTVVTDADESMVVKSGVDEVPITLTETKYENASVVKREKEKLVAVKHEEEILVAVKPNEEIVVAVKPNEEILVAVKPNEEILVASKCEEEKLVAAKREEEKLIAAKREEEKLVAVKPNEENLVAVDYPEPPSPLPPPPPPLDEETEKEPSTVIHPTLDGQQLKWTTTIETARTGYHIPDITTDQSITVIKRDSNTSTLNSGEADAHPVVTENIETEDFGKLRSATNVTETETNTPPIYENMSKLSYVETATRSKTSSESSSTSTSTFTRSSSHSKTREIDQKTYILEKPTVPPVRERREVVDDYDPAYDVAHAFLQRNNSPPQSVEFDGSERDIDYEINNRKPRPGSPYSTILDLEVDEDDIRAREIPSGVKPVAAGRTPIAAGVKTSRPSITPIPDTPISEPETPVYSVVNKKKIAHGDDTIQKHYHDSKMEDLKTDVKTKKEPKKSSKKNPFSIFGKSKDKKVKIKRQISGPVGQVVHYSGQSDATQIKTLGVGIYREGARTGSQPEEEKRPTGQVEIVNFTPGSDDDDQISDPTLHQTMFIDLPRESREPAKKKKKPPKKVTIVTNEQSKQSMFSDVHIEQKPIPSPLLEPNYEIEPPTKFRDSKPPKQQKPPRRAVRQISKEDIGLPMGAVVHENGKSSPELMDAFGIEVKGRSTLERDQDKPKIIKSNNTAVRSDSILDLRETGRRSSEPAISSSEEEGRRKRRGRRPRRKSSPGEDDRRRRRRSSEPAPERKVEETPPKPTTQSRDNAYMSLVKNQIPGLENVEPTVIEKYVKTLVSLPVEQTKPRQPAEQTKPRQPAPTTLDLQPQQESDNMFDPDMIEQYISHMQKQQKQRGIRAGELDFFDPRVLRKYRRLTKTPAEEKVKKPVTEKDLRKKSQEIFSQRRASIGKFLANPENRRRSESFTYLNMSDKRGPWYKEDGQQDKGLTKDELAQGRRVSAAPKKDPRFPDYYKRPVVPVQRARSMTALDNHLKARLQMTKSQDYKYKDRSLSSSSSAMPDRYRQLIRTPEDFIVEDPPDNPKTSIPGRKSEKNSPDHCRTIFTT